MTRTYRLTVDGTPGRMFEVRVPSPHKAIAYARECNEEAESIDELQAQAAAMAEQDDVKMSDVLKATERVQMTFCAIYGYLLGVMLVAEVPARRKDALTLQWGLEVYDALFDAGWAAEEIVTAYQTCAQLCAEVGNTMHYPGSPSLEKVKAIEDFGGAPTEAPTSC